MVVLPALPFTPGADHGRHDSALKTRCEGVAIICADLNGTEPDGADMQMRAYPLHRVLLNCIADRHRDHHSRATKSVPVHRLELDHLGVLVRYLLQLA